MADVIRYVNTNSTSGGNGTSNLTTGSTRAYPSLNDWDANEATNLVTDGDTHTVICDPAGGADTTDIGPMSGWTTGASNTLTIKAAAGSECNGESRENAGTGYQVRVGGDVINARMTHIIVEDIELTVTGGSNVLEAAGIPASSTHIYRRCILSKTDSTSSSTYLVTQATSNLDLTLEECVVIAYNTRPMDIRGINSATIDQCAFICENGVGALLDGGATVTDTWFFNNSGAAIHSASSAPNSSSTNNAANDGSMTSESWAGTNQESLTMSNEITAVGTDFADPSTFDGSTLTSGTKTFETYNIGPYEVPSVGGTAIPIFYHHYGRNLA